MAKMFPTNLFMPHWPIGECPHCHIQRPNMMFSGQALGTSTDDERVSRVWGTYVCSTCASVILVERYTSVSHNGQHALVAGMKSTLYPAPQTVSDDIPPDASRYLTQAINTLSSPDASVMVSASAVDAMLKHIGLTEGHLYPRIRKAQEDGIITQGMADWAHEVRLAANEQRHADESAEPATFEDATRQVEFAKALAEFLFVLPARVTRGRMQRQDEQRPVTAPVQTTSSPPPATPTRR